MFVKTDVAIEANTIKTYGRLDYAFNDAGIEKIMTPFLDQTSKKFEQIMNTNETEAEIRIILTALYSFIFLATPSPNMSLLHFYKDYQT